MRTTIAGSPAAASCACSNSSRTPCMLTRAKSSVTVVSAPATSNVPCRRTSCSAQALSLPLDQAISACGGAAIIHPRRGAGAGAARARSSRRRRDGLASSGSFRSPMRRKRRFGGALARFPGAVDRTPFGGVQRLAGEPDAAAERLDQRIARVGVAGARRRHGAEHVRLLVPARDVAARDCVCDAGAEQRRQPLAREIEHGRLALGRQLAAESARHLDQMQVAAGYSAEQRRGARARRLLEHQIVALQIERIARHQQRDMVVAAEREIVRGLEHVARQVRLEFDSVGGQHIGRSRHDCRARAQPALAGGEFDAVAIPVDPRDRASTAAAAGRRRAWPAARHNPAGRTPPGRAHRHAPDPRPRRGRDPCRRQRARARIRWSAARRRDRRAARAPPPRRPCRGRPSSMARCERSSAARKFSSSPARALRGPTRTACPRGAG